MSKMRIQCQIHWAKSLIRNKTNGLHLRIVLPLRVAQILLYMTQVDLCKYTLILLQINREINKKQLRKNICTFGRCTQLNTMLAVYKRNRKLIPSWITYQLCPMDTAGMLVSWVIWVRPWFQCTQLVCKSARFLSCTQLVCYLAVSAVMK